MQVLEPREFKSAVRLRPCAVTTARRAARSGVITPAEIRDELARVIASEDFAVSARNRSFLEFIVRCALTNGTQEPRVTAADVAMEVFGRGKNFHAQLDPIVRIEAGKLRRGLETYYLKSGRHNPLRIEVPLGGYCAVFRRRTKRDEPVVREVPALTGDLARDAADELQRVLDSPDFPATPRNRRFLAYVVKNELAAVPEENSARLLGERIFGRRPDFNPNKDPIVRIEAVKLRQDLETYYLKSGRGHRLRITLPKGRYRPVFVRSN